MFTKPLSGILVLVVVISFLFGKSVTAETEYNGGETGSVSIPVMERAQKIPEVYIQPAELEAIQPILYPIKIYLPTVQKAAIVLFKDDFSNPSSGWPVGTNAYGIWAYLNGEYKMKVLKIDTFLWATAGHSVADFDVKVDARQADTNDSSYGIIFELNTTTDQFYVFLVDPEYQDWYLAYYNGVSWTPLASGNSGYVNAGTAKNNVEVRRKGLNTKFLVNGSEVYSTVLASTGAHTIGLAAESWDLVNADVRFDNYLVTTP